MTLGVQGCASRSRGAVAGNSLGPRGRTVCRAAVRKVGYFGCVVPDGQGDRSSTRRPDPMCGSTGPDTAQWHPPLTCHVLRISDRCCRPPSVGPATRRPGACPPPIMSGRWPQAFLFCACTPDQSQRLAVRRPGSFAIGWGQRCSDWHRIASHRIASHRIASHRITSHHITSHHITSHHITSHHITSHHIGDVWRQACA